MAGDYRYHGTTDFRPRIPKPDFTGCLYWILALIALAAVSVGLSLLFDS
ncbi:hypothetical protein [Owenweeksia hongkongensis]